MLHRVIIVMGVSGCGKSTIGQMLSDQTGIPFFDADDYHPPANLWSGVQFESFSSAINGNCHDFHSPQRTLELTVTRRSLTTRSESLSWRIGCAWGLRHELCFGQRPLHYYTGVYVSSAKLKESLLFSALIEVHGMKAAGETNRPTQCAH